jgi:hypothetical protein
MKELLMTDTLKRNLNTIDTTPAEEHCGAGGHDGKERKGKNLLI